MTGDDAMARAGRFAETVRQKLGERVVSTDPADIEPWLHDWRGRFHGRSAALLQPSNRDEVVRIVAMAADCGVPLVAQGGNTSMVGSATPPEDGSAVILSLRRMNHIRSLDAYHVVADAGVILANLHEAVAAAHCRFPLNLGARGSCTVGGLVATNAGGTQVLRFGPMRSLVLGVEAVLPDGSIHDGLASLKKDNRGYSIDQLLIGSEGTLGIITAAALKLVPAIAGRAVAWVGLDSPRAALTLLRHLERKSDGIEGFEIIPVRSLDLVLRHIPGTRAPLTGRHPWHALIEFTAATPDIDPEQRLQQLLAEAADDGLLGDAVVSSSEAQAGALWRLRDSISEAERAEGPTLAHDISVPVEVMPEFMIEAAQSVEQAFPGVSASGFGHLGDGNVHFHVRRGDRDIPDWQTVEGLAVTRLVHNLVTSSGGSISAEHGIGQMKLDEFARLAPPGRIAVLQAIKRALDPLGLMNPGKLVPPAGGQSQRT